MDVQDTLGSPVDTLRPVLRAMQNADDMHGLALDAIDHNIRQRLKHQFAGAGLLSRSATLREALQHLRGMVKRAYQLRRMLRRVLKQIIADAFQVARGLASSATPSARGFFSKAFLQAQAHFLVAQQFAPVGGGQALLHLTDKPLVIVHKALNGLSGQQLGIASALGGHLAWLRLHVWI